MPAVAALLGELEAAIAAADAELALLQPWLEQPDATAAAAGAAGAAATSSSAAAIAGADAGEASATTTGNAAAGEPPVLDAPRLAALLRDFLAPARARYAALLELQSACLAALQGVADYFGEAFAPSEPNRIFVLLREFLTAFGKAASEAKKAVAAAASSSGSGGGASSSGGAASSGGCSAASSARR